MKKEVANPSKPKINIINLIFIFFYKTIYKPIKICYNINIESEADKNDRQTNIDKF